MCQQWSYCVGRKCRLLFSVPPFLPAPTSLPPDPHPHKGVAVPQEKWRARTIAAWHGAPPAPPLRYIIKPRAQPIWWERPARVLIASRPSLSPWIRPDRLTKPEAGRPTTPSPLPLEAPGRLHHPSWRATGTPALLELVPRSPYPGGRRGQLWGPAPCQGQDACFKAPYLYTTTTTS